MSDLHIQTRGSRNARIPSKLHPSELVSLATYGNSHQVSAILYVHIHLRLVEFL